MKDITGYEGLYAAHKKGRVWSRMQKRFLKPWLIGHGYESVMLYKSKIPRKFLVHRLVAQTYIPNLLNLPEVNHKNANRLDNSVRNLEWVTSKQNKRHAMALGRYDNRGKNPAVGINHGLAKLTEKEVREIRSCRERGELYREIANKFNLSKENVSMICRRITWKHIL